MAVEFQTMRRLGLFGGSFDPVHLGHVLVAQAAREELELERVFFIPTACSPFKQENQPAPESMRARMLRLALAGHAAYEVDELEFRRGGVSYSVDTLRHYRQRYPEAELYWLIGADNLASLPKWRHATELVELAHFVAIPRPGETAVSFPPPFRGRVLKGFPFGVSSSEIRSRIQAGLPVDQLVPPGVAECIRNNRLYL